MLIIIAITPVKKRFILNGRERMMNNIRININYITFEVIMNHPITGIGFGLQTYEKLDLKKFEKRLPLRKYRKKNYCRPA